VPPTRQQKLLAFSSLAVVAAIGTTAGLMLVGGGSSTPHAATSTSPSPSPSRSPVASPSPSPSPTMPAFDRLALRRAPVPSLCGHPAGTLVDGHLPGTPPGEAGVQLGDTAFGDLDGDGQAEGVAVIGCALGTTVVRTVHVYRNPLAYVARADAGATLGKPIAITGVRVTAGVLEVSARYPDKDDAACCPTGYVVQRFRLQSGTMKLQPPIGGSRTARLTGDGWSTIRVGATYAELARATGLTVTISSLDDPNVDTAPCTYVELGGTFPGFSIVGGAGKVRAVVFSKPGVFSKSGVGVGSTEQQVLTAYGSRAQRVTNQYSPIQDVVVQAGPGHVVRFEFDDQHVVKDMHGGETQFAMLVEGCS
jgi:hypothetical protein